MKTYDLAQLGTSLNALAEAYDRKPLSVKAVEIWFETLKEFPTARVMGLLASWPKYHGKMPVPSEIWKALNDIALADRERIADSEQAEARKPVMFSRTTGGKRALQDIKSIMSEPKLSPREHWHRNLSTKPPESIGYEYAVEALKILERKRA